MFSIYLILLLSFFNCILKTESTHYETLKVDQNATPDEIEEAFNKLKEENRNAKISNKDFIKKLEKLSEAFTILSDEKKRKEYDRELEKKAKGKSSKGESSTHGYQRAEEPRKSSQSFRRSSHFMEGSSHNAGSFFGSGFPFDGSSPFGSGFPFGGSNQSGNWNGGVTTVKLIVFKEGMLVEGSGYNSEYVKTLSINGGVSFATIYGNNIKLTEYWMKTKIIINGNEVQYSEGVTNINGVRIEKNGEKIKITGKSLNLNNTNLKGSKILKGSVVECSVNGGVSNITTNKQKYVFNHRNPNMPIRQKLNINGGITHLEMHIADAESDNYIKINGGISNAEINGMGTNIGKEEITNDTNTVEISTYGGGGYRSGETEIIIEGNSLSIDWRSVF